VRVLLEAASEKDDHVPLPDRLVGEARHFFRMRQAVLLMVSGVARHVKVCAIDPLPQGKLRQLVPLPEIEPLRRTIGGSEAAEVYSGEEAAQVAEALGLDGGTESLLVVPIRGRKLLNYMLVLADNRAHEFGDAQLDIVEAFAAAVGAGLSRFQLARANAVETSRQAALSVAAKNLNSSLDLNRVLVRVCEEAARILEADTAVVYLGDAERGLRMEAGTGVGPEAIGLRIEPGQGLAGRVAEQNRPMLTNHYQALTGTPSVYADLRHAMAVPMHWNGQPHGVLSLGWTRFRMLKDEDLGILSAFGEIAGSACRNATTHEGLITASRTDALTGCLNRAAFQETLRTELDRSGRSGQNVSLIIVDMDDFKQVNERHGHLVGDEVLRRVGRALRTAVRPYDVVGRYGGDEFALLAVDADESEARDIADRAIEGVAASLDKLEAASECGAATAGVAQWAPGEAETALFDRADRALLHGKHRGLRGSALRASDVVEPEVNAA